MSTTLVMAVVENGMAVLANVGDSRGYLFREGNLKPVTRDHSVVQELVELGQLTSEEAAVHPHRHIITRAVGLDELTEASLYEIPVQAGDRFLLCSDGLTDMLEASQIEAYMTMENEKDMVHALLDGANESGGVDNITAAVLTL